MTAPRLKSLWQELALRPLVLPGLAFLAIACAPAGRDPGPETYVFRGQTMGTYYAIQVVDTGLDESRRTEVLQLIEDELEDVNARMSTWIDDSELSRFNQHTETTPFSISAVTFGVVEAALEVARMTDGAYDVTIEPLIDAWGFGSGGHETEPSPDDIQRLVASVGYTKLELDHTAMALRKHQPDLSCNLSSIAKGYGVDRVAEALLAAGYDNIWVEVGGEVRAAGRNAEDRVWRLGIERPRLEPGALQRIVPLDGAAVATSGDYRNYREVDGARISHIIDPRSGSPIRHRLASVSVVHPQCMIADALATGLMVLGPEEGWELALREELAVLFLVREGEGFREIMTPRFQALTESQSLPKSS